MFLNILQENEKKYALGLMINIAKVNDVLSNTEINILNIYAQEMNIEFSNISNYELKTELILEQLKESTTESKKIIYLEAIGLILVDGFDESAKALLKEIQNSFNLSDEYSKELLNWVITFMPLYKDGLSLLGMNIDSKTSNKNSYAGILTTAIGSSAGVIGSLGAVSATGSVAGLGATGVTSGLAAIGGIAGGGMIAGLLATAAIPIAVGGASYGLYKLFSNDTDLLAVDNGQSETISQNLQGIIAILYSLMYLNGNDKNINILIKNWYTKQLDYIRNNHSEDMYVQELNKLNSLKFNMKLSTAIKYLIITDNYEEVFPIIDDLLMSIIKSDGRKSDQEEAFIKDYELFKKKGIESINKIKEDELSYYLIESYYITSTPNSYNEDIHNCHVITPQDESFTNITQLIPNRYYIKHPVDPSQLIAIEDVFEINMFLMEEFRTVAAFLGAKTFHYEEFIEETSSTNNDVNNNFSLSGIINGITATVNIDSSSKNTKNSKLKSIRQKKAEFKSSTPSSKEVIYSKLVWLKNNYRVIQLIEQRYSTNPIVSWEDQFSLESFLLQSSNFSIDTVINVMTQLESRGKLTKTNNHEEMKKIIQKITITF